MKILCCISSRNDGILYITDSLRQMGHTVYFFPTEAYREICSYPQKKLDKLGFHAGREAYLEKWRDKLRSVLSGAHLDLALFIGSPCAMMTPQELQSLQMSVPTVCWFVDAVKESEDREYLPYYDRVFVFEKRDVVCLRNHHNIEAMYCPVGYNSAYEYTEKQQGKDIDIVFVGSPFKNRLRILEEFCMHATLNHWKVAIYGPFYEKKYFWKSCLFQRQYPHIMKYLYNGRIAPECTASLYARSKICLNIHLPAHKGVNPRTFEIMATGSFQIIDEREDYAGLVPEQDLAVFHSTEDLIEKISYYLAHEEERERIAAHGHAAVLGRYSMEASLNRILNDCRE